MYPMLTAGIDVALLVFWAFVLFFIGLVFYLRREDRREGYPLEDEVSGRVDTVGGAMHTASDKFFRLPFGHGTVAPRGGNREPVQIAARRIERFAGAPYAPTGDPLVDGIGPAAWANRADRPDLDMEGHPRIVPISTAADFWVAKEDPGVTGWPVIGADGVEAGVVNDLWIDRADRLVRYLQLNTDAGGALLVPMMDSKLDRRHRRIDVRALNGAQIARAPRVAAADRITLLEEDRVQAYFGGGYLYANAARQEPWL